MLRLWCPLRLHSAVNRLWEVRRSVIRFFCQHVLLLQCAATERCWSVRLWFTCQWTPNKETDTVLPSSTTEHSNFEDVPFSVPGRACQDDSFVNSVDNIKRQVAPFVFLVHHGVSVASGRLLNLGYAAGHPFFEMSCSFTNQMLAQLDSLRYWFAETARCESGVIAPSHTRGGDHRLSPGTHCTPIRICSFTSGKLTEGTSLSWVFQCTLCRFLCRGHKFGAPCPAWLVFHWSQYYLNIILHPLCPAGSLRMYFCATVLEIRCGFRGYGYAFSWST